jgi:hypothetical protein
VALSAGVVREWLAPSLEGAGFRRKGRSGTWLRQANTLVHIVNFEQRAERLLTQWGVLDPALIPMLWPEQPADASERVAYSFMTGWLERLPGTALQTPPLQGGPELQLIREDLRVAARWLSTFAQRRAACEYLLAEQKPTDRRGFIVPSMLPLKLTTCAFLSAVSGESSAAALAHKALTATEIFGDVGLSGHRRRQLRAIAAGADA